MKKFTKLIALVLAILVFTSTFVLPAAAAELSPRYEARYCTECASTNTTFLGYTYLFTVNQGSYKQVYYDANYRCNNCGISFSYLHVETVPVG